MFINTTRKTDNQPILINLDDISCIIKNKLDNSTIFTFKDDSFIETIENYNTIIKLLANNGLYAN